MGITPSPSVSTGRGVPATLSTTPSETVHVDRDRVRLFGAEIEAHRHPGHATHFHFVQFGSGILQRLRRPVVLYIVVCPDYQDVVASCWT